MKYFTKDWWASGGEEPPAVLERYQAYFASVRDRLPAKLVSFQDDHTLHDARLETIFNDFERHAVVVELAGWDQSFEHQVKYKLTFLGVSQFHQRLPEGCNDAAELGDLGYDEIEVFGSQFEMRLLFSSTAEFSITFSDFAFELAAK